MNITITDRTPKINLTITDNREIVNLSVQVPEAPIHLVIKEHIGKDGVDGAKGDKGDKGEQGIQGAQGEQGLPGAKGDKGDKGDVGAQGEKGKDGYTPIKGVDYFDGAKGDKGDDATINFATQPELESQTPPDTENNKAVSLFGLWKWVKKLNYLYLNITTANSTLNKIWYDGLNAWVTNKDGINKQLAYDGDTVRRIDGTFNPPTQAQLTTLGIKRGDFYQNTNTNQRAMYNGNQLVEWTVTTSEYNALSTDQKNAVKNLSIIVI